MEVIMDEEITKQLTIACQLKEEYKINEIEFEVINKLNIDFLPKCIENIIQEYYNDIFTITNVSVSNYSDDVLFINFTDENDVYYSFDTNKKHTISTISGYLKLSELSCALYDFIDIDHYYDIIYNLLDIINMFMIDKHFQFNFITHYADNNCIQRKQKYKYTTYCFKYTEGELIQNIEITNDILFEIMARITKQILLACNVISN
jgi:hypothetical protein